MKNYSLILLFIFSFAIVIIFSFKQNKLPETLILDETTYIRPMIHNEETNESFIRTFKVGYKDINKKLSTNELVKYSCSYQSKLIFYSAFDSLALNGLPQQSCLIVAFFNLERNQAKWFINNNVFYIKIVNTNTGKELIFDNPQPSYFSKIFEQYNLIK